MSERALVKQAWLDANLYSSKDSKLTAFLQHFEEAKFACWSDFIQEVREHYSEHKEQIVTAIWDTGDKLLRLHLIRAADPNNDEDRALFQKLVQRPNTRGNDWELDALMRVAQRRGIA